MFVRKLSGPITREKSADRTRRRHRALLSLDGLRDWQLEDRCLLSTVLTMPIANPVGPQIQVFSEVLARRKAGDCAYKLAGTRQHHIRPTV